MIEMGALSGSRKYPALGQQRRAVFLDRDGVINAMVYNPEFGLVDSPQNADQFVLLPGVARAIRLISDLGLLVVVVSNQPGIAKGKYTPAVLEEVTTKMRRTLAEEGARLDGVYYCLHHPMGLLEEYRRSCDCRKPRPGLLQRAASELGIDLKASFMIGDGLSDILAGKAAGCTAVLLGSHKCDLCRTMEDLDARPHFVAHDLAEAAEIIGARSRAEPCDLSERTAMRAASAKGTPGVSTA